MPTDKYQNSYVLRHSQKPVHSDVVLPASKSISNRLLIIKALCKEKFEIKNLSTSDDTRVLLECINNLNSSPDTLDVLMAGTSFRFLTALLTFIPGEYTLTGSERLRQRPIQPLVKALQDIGAKINYADKEGYAPLEISNAPLKGGSVTIDGSISSQFVSALMLIGPMLPEGLNILIKGNTVSRPYINMTLKLMNYFGANVSYANGVISIPCTGYTVDNLKTNDKGERFFEVEADWTAASYWYAICALSPGSNIKLYGLFENSIQGDSLLPAIFTFLGVTTTWDHGVCKLKHNGLKEERFGFDFSDNPDLAQTIAVVTAALNIPCMLNGLKTLKDKETNRIEALKNELNKIKVDVYHIGEDALYVNPSEKIIPSSLAISTYNDHRMAMAFAPLCLCLNEVIIESPEVVNKSYPDFWKHLVKAGFEVN